MPTRKTRAAGRKATARAKSPRRSTTSARPDPTTRIWTPLPVAARMIGFHWRTLRKYLKDEPFVRVLGERWYVKLPEFLDWWERQRPSMKAEPNAAGSQR